MFFFPSMDSTLSMLSLLLSVIRKWQHSCAGSLTILNLSGWIHRWKKDHTLCLLCPYDNRDLELIRVLTPARVSIKLGITRNSCFLYSYYFLYIPTYIILLYGSLMQYNNYTSIISRNWIMNEQHLKCRIEFGIIPNTFNI